MCFTALDEQDEHPTSAILQQGCDLTNGLYLKIANVAGLLEYLMVRSIDDEIIRKYFQTIFSIISVGIFAGCGIT